jgi:hypothetical protein
MRFDKNFFKGCPCKGSLFSLLCCGLLCLGSCDMPGTQFSLHRAWISQKFVTASGMDLAGNNRIVRFYENGTYTMFGSLSRYDVGRWVQAQKANYMILHPKRGNLEWIDAYWQYQPVSRTEMKTFVYRNAAMRAGTEEGFYMMKGFAAKGSHDPFHPDMNQWRIPPDTTESMDEIRQRVLDFLLFQKAWYEFARDNDLEMLPTGWYPQPMQMHYANGVRMAYADELADWNTCFFDSVAAVRGYQYIGGALREVKLLATENRIERNLDCVNQMMEVLKSQKILQQ